MRGKTLQVILALFWLIWTAVVIPLHTPGVVQYSIELNAPQKDGRTQTVCYSGGCPLCALSQTPANSNGQIPTQRKSGGCVICDFKAKLTMGNVVVWDLRFLELLQKASVRTDAAVTDVEPIRAWDSRAPPTA